MQAITQKEFDKLPALLGYTHLIELGFKRSDVEGYVESGELGFIQSHADGRRRYLKADVAKLLGFSF